MKLSLLVVAALLAAGCPGGGIRRPPTPLRTHAAGDVVGKTWWWRGTTTPIEEVTSPAPDHYVVTLLAGGRLLARVDCNRGSASYEIDDTGHMRVGPLATTRMACPPGSLDARFARDLAEGTRFFVEAGELHIELPRDGGTLHFVPGQ